MHKYNSAHLPKKEDLLRKLMQKYNSKKPDNRFLLAKALDQVYLFFNNREICFTDFLDPVSIEKLLGVICEFGIKATVFGGHSGAEREKIGLAEGEIAWEIFPIKRIIVKYPQKFAPNLAHGDFLGSVLGLGIDRSKIGDIVITMQGAVIIVDDGISEFIVMNLEKVGRTGVRAELLADDDEFFGLNNQRRIRISVASLRLDNVLAQGFGVARRDAADAVGAGRVFVNWRGADSPSRLVQEGDMVTLRGSGRIRIDEIGGKSRKDKIYVDITRY